MTRYRCVQCGEEPGPDTGWEVRSDCRWGEPDEEWPAPHVVLGEPPDSELPLGHLRRTPTPESPRLCVPCGPVLELTDAAPPGHTTRQSGTP